jgi:hypothetical protein
MVMMFGYIRYVAETRAKKVLSLLSKFLRLVDVYNDVFQVDDTVKLEVPISNEMCTAEDMIEI